MACERPPRLRAKVGFAESFIDAAATPPLEVLSRKGISPGRGCLDQYNLFAYPFSMEAWISSAVSLVSIWSLSIRPYGGNWARAIL